MISIAAAQKNAEFLMKIIIKQQYLIGFEMLCKTRKCPFYKTRRQFIEDLKKYPLPEGMHRRIKD